MKFSTGSSTGREEINFTNHTSSETFRRREFVSADVMQNLVALPRDFVEHIAATLVAKSDMGERDAQITMRKETRDLQNSMKADKKLESLRESIRRRNSAKINLMLSGKRSI